MSFSIASTPSASSTTLLPFTLISHNSANVHTCGYRRTSSMKVSARSTTSVSGVDNSPTKPTLGSIQHQHTNKPFTTPACTRDIMWFLSTAMLLNAYAI
jgi:flagellar basal body rod protein FlgG